MSISLPNGTLLAAPSSTTQQYTAAVTRILHLTNFSPELKTRDLQGFFKDYENEKGGFRIKWLDDVNALVVFNDAGVAKRAYLTLLLHPPPTFLGQIRPYDRPDAAQIIHSLAARTMGHRGSTSIARGAGSFSVQPGAKLNGNGNGNGSVPGGAGVHGRTMSSSSAFGGFVMPVSRSRPSISSGVPAQTAAPGSSGPSRMNGTGPGTGSGSGHGRTGSSSYSRQPLAGVLNFAHLPGSNGARLPTHSESQSGSAAMSASSSDTEPTIVLDTAPTASESSGATGVGGIAGMRGHGGFGGGGSGVFGAWKPMTGSGFSGVGGTSGSARAPRRDSLSAEKAMKEVEKALASVEAS